MCPVTILSAPSLAAASSKNAYRTARAASCFPTLSAFARPANVVEVQRLGRTINALVLRDGAILQVGPNYSKAVAERLKLAE